MERALIQFGYATQFQATVSFSRQDISLSSCMISDESYKRINVMWSFTQSLSEDGPRWSILFRQTG